MNRNGRDSSSPTTQSSATRSETALVPFNPNQPQNHMRIMAEVQDKRAARLQEAQSLSRAGKVNIAQRAQALAPHVDKLNVERTELAKWNINGQGRNQGLTHIIDYAYAPPPRNKDSGHAQLLAHSSMTGKAIREKLGMSSDDFNKISRKDLMQGNLTPKGQRLLQHQQNLSKRMDSMMSGTTDEGEKKRIGMSSEYQALRRDKAALDPHIRDQTFYTSECDTSKQGRIQQVEKSAGLSSSESFKTPSPSNPHGSEIVGVTKELDRLSSHAATTEKVTPAKGGTVDIDTHVKVGTNPNGTSKWEFQKGVTVPNTATSSKLETDSHSSKLRVEKWGPTSTSTKYSTVMGRK